MGSLDFGVATELALVEARIRESIVTEEPLLHDIARYVIESGGKRIRPMVTLLAFRALGGTEVRQAVDLAAAFELIHSATLIHDDINDGGDMRRGRLAAYKKFGLQNALVTGDFLFVKAFWIGGRFDDDIVEITANVCAALAEGEIRQKRHAHDTGVTRSEYLDIIQRKTALPMSAGARVAGLLANARLEHIEAVGDYGINLGMAFQIVDDVLDVVGDASRLGKPPGTDVREGNVTLVTIHALNDGSAIDVRALERLVRKHRKQDVDVRRVLSLLRDSGAVEKARLDAQAYGQLAKKALDPIADSDAKASMIRLVDYVLSRDTCGGGGMRSPYDVVVVASGPAGGTAAWYAARRGVNVLVVEKRKEIGVPVQGGAYVVTAEGIG